MSSIDNELERETAEAPAEHPLADGSVGSDTETARTLISDDGSKDISESPHHARSNSIKKPAIFKAVSVTKNFLAKAGTAPTPNAKVSGDKVMSTTATTTAAPVPRPRLVAKSASGHQASTPKSATGFRNGGTGPDPMQVWNKNRAAPQAPQKHFTDEELKQQYGIHLATRLQADADGKEAKWADIDDDEDDWAPDTIEWNDGTKITLSHNDPAAALAEEQAAAAEKARQEEQNRTRMPPPKATSSVGPNAKVLKLGASAPLKQAASGTTLKTPLDKPTLVAKPAPPAPVKSPWAALPPVDKVAPVAINPSPQSSTPKPQQGISQPSESAPAPVPAPAVATMEIAADSFTRTPRDNQGGAQGQLFNSQSGQYEPVTSGRRGSVRKDQNFRPPAVLQRPSPVDQRPAEPSPAFQNQRSGSQQDASRWDRRASSTISGGSGLQGRRASMSQGAVDINQQRGDAQALQSPQTPSLAQVHPAQDETTQPHPQPSVQSPALSKAQQVRDMAAAASSPLQGRGQLADGPTTPLVSVDMNAETERQKKLMKEKRELAIKRKREEEEKEEAAKKERIRIKMEQLGLPPLEKQGPDKKSSEVKQVVKREINQETQSPAQQQEEVAKIQPSPKPPAPEIASGSKDYGMMTLHGPSTNGIVPDEEPAEVRNVLPDRQVSPPKAEPSTHVTARIASPLVNGIVDKGPSIPGSPETREQHVFQPQRQRPWNNVPRDSNGSTAWNGSGMTTHSAPSGNLWGPPSNHKALGNGVFDGNVPRASPQHPPYQDHHHPQPTPQPIGPPRSLQRPRESPESGLVQHAKPSPSIENLQTAPPYPSQDGASPPFNRGEPGSMESRPNAAPRTAASMPSRPQISPDRLPTDLRQQRSSLAAWGNFQSTSAKEDAEKRRQADMEHAARIAEEARTGIRFEPQLPVLNETWRQVKVDDEAGQRRVVGVAKGVNAPDVSTSQPVNGDIRVPPFANQPLPFHPAGAGRGSRFFPTSGPNYQNQQRAFSYTVGYNRSPSPPPPDSSQHPAYTRSQHHPLVNLPITKPKPTVRLPPALTADSTTSVTAEAPVLPLRAVSQPLVQNPSWQDRFNGLLGVKKAVVSPEKKFAEVAGFSETKLPLELPPIQASAAVSLPSKDADAMQAEGNGAVASILVEDQEALFEEREFGSLPIVLLPNATPKIKSQKNRKGFPKSARDARPAEDVMSKVVFEFSLEDKEHDDPNGFAIFINFKGIPFPKKKIMPRSNVGTASLNMRTNRPSQVPNRSGKVPRPRDSSGNFVHQKPGQAGPQRTPTQHSPTQQGKGAWGKTWARVSTAG